MDAVPAAIRHEFARHKRLADRAIAALTDDEFFRRPAPHVNPVAVIVKHLGGNLRSRWTDFLTTDGDKPGRDRDAEFRVEAGDTRAGLLDAWEQGWAAVLGAIDALTAADGGRTVTIRGEPHTALQALLRGATHAAYHTGQILYVARFVRPDAPWLTIAPNQSQTHPAGYLAPPG